MIHQVKDPTKNKCFGFAFLWGIAVRIFTGKNHSTVFLNGKPFLSHFTDIEGSKETNSLRDYGQKVQGWSVQCRLDWELFKQVLQTIEQLQNKVLAVFKFERQHSFSFKKLWNALSLWAVTVELFDTLKTENNKWGNQEEWGEWRKVTNEAWFRYDVWVIAQAWGPNYWLYSLVAERPSQVKTSEGMSTYDIMHNPVHELVTSCPKNAKENWRPCTTQCTSMIFIAFYLAMVLKWKKRNAMWTKFLKGTETEYRFYPILLLKIMKIRH